LTALSSALLPVSFMALLLCSISACTSSKPQVVAKKRLNYYSEIYNLSDLKTKDLMGLDVDLTEKDQPYTGVVKVILAGQSLGKGMYSPNEASWLLDDLANDEYLARVVKILPFLRNFACAAYGKEMALLGGGSYGRIDRITESPTAKTYLYNLIRSELLPGPSLHQARREHRMINVDANRVLILGGITTGNAAALDVELFDASSGTIKTVGKMVLFRREFLLTRLPSGKILVSGGIGNQTNEAPGDLVSTVEVFDPVKEKYFVAGQLHEARVGHSAIVLPDGAIFLGGRVPDEGGQQIDSNTVEAVLNQ
jgi:hypothetical protein